MWERKKSSLNESWEKNNPKVVKEKVKIEVWLIIVYYNIVLVLVLMIWKKLINKNNHRFYLVICLSVKNINMHPVKKYN
jgi:hypothetical protein